MISRDLSDSVTPQGERSPSPNTTSGLVVWLSWGEGISVWPKGTGGSAGRSKIHDVSLRNPPTAAWPAPSTDIYTNTTSGLVVWPSWGKGISVWPKASVGSAELVCSGYKFHAVGRPGESINETPQTNDPKKIPHLKLPQQLVRTADPTTQNSIATTHTKNTLLHAHLYTYY